MRRILLLIFGCTLWLLAAGPAPAGPLAPEQGFQPDVYPSEVLAMQGLARLVVEALHGTEQFSQSGSTIILIRSGASDEAIDALAHGLRRELPGANVSISDGSNSGPGTAPATNPRDGVRIEPIGSGQPNTIALAVSGAGIERMFWARYIDKPWAADWKMFVSQHPRHGWVLGQSPRPAASEAEALDLARRSVVDALWPVVRERITRRGRIESNGLLLAESSARRHLGALLREGRYVEDVLVQKFERPYGPVYQASVLIDGSAESLDAMADYCARSTRARLEARAIGWGSAGGFVAVMVLLYLLINALTKGYFAWRLRAAALLLSIAGILIVLAVT